jgi:hypothetical protein
MLITRTHLNRRFVFGTFAAIAMVMSAQAQSVQVKFQWPTESAAMSLIIIRGPRKIAVAGNREHLWGEQRGIETGTKRNHSRTNSRHLTSGDNFSRSP